VNQAYNQSILRRCMHRGNENTEWYNRVFKDYPACKARRIYYSHPSNSAKPARIKNGASFPTNWYMIPPKGGPTATHQIIYLTVRNLQKNYIFTAARSRIYRSLGDISRKSFSNSVHRLHAFYTIFYHNICILMCMCNWLIYNMK